MGEKRGNTTNVQFVGWILFCLAIFLFMAIFYNTAAGRTFDLGIIHWVQGLENPFLTKMMKFLSWAGEGKAIYTMAAVLVGALFLRRRFALGLFLGMAIPLGSGVLNRLLKSHFMRERPNFHRLIEIDGTSFPSGHAMNTMVFWSFATFALLTFLGKRGRKGLMAVSAAIILFTGISRIYLGVHYPTDIIGGFAAGAGWVLLCIFLYRLALKEQA